MGWEDCRDNLDIKTTESKIYDRRQPFVDSAAMTVIGIQRAIKFSEFNYDLASFNRSSLNTR